MVEEAGCLGAGLAHAFGEAGGAVGILALGAEVFAGDLPVGAVARAGRLDVRGLFAWMRLGGIEPPTCGLKDRCSLAPRRLPLTTELQARRSG